MLIHQHLVESNRRRRPRRDSLFAIEPTAEPGVVVKMSHETRRRHCIDRDTLF
jgi:hypothetical protein